MSEVAALLIALCLTLAIRAAAGTWLHPSVLFSAVWALLLSVPVVWVDLFDPLGGASWLVVGAIMSVSAGALITIPVRERRELEFRFPAFLRYFVLLGGPAAALSAVIVHRANGVSLTSFSGLIDAARAITRVRYGGDMYSPPVATVLLAGCYGAALIAPFVATRYSGMRRIFWTTFPAVGAAVYALLTTARAPFLIAAAITAGAWLSTVIVSSGGRSRVSSRGIAGAVAGAASVVGVFILVAANRRGGLSESSAEELIRSATLYSSGSLPALGKWLPSAPELPVSIGVETFAGVSQFLLMDLSLGSARDDVSRIGSGMSTNVYSVFRVLIEDFSVAGMFVFLALGSIVVSVGFRRSVTHGSVAGALSVSLWGSFVLFSQTTSLFTFANVCLGLFMGSLVLLKWLQIEAPYSRPVSVGHGVNSTVVIGCRDGGNALID